MNKKDILISVKPQYASLLVDGIKLVELRRKFPESIKSGTKCFIYSTSPVKRVIGHCRIGSIEKLNLVDLWSEHSYNAMISWKDFEKYFCGLEYGFAVKLYGYTRYKNAIEVDKISGTGSRPPQSYRYITRNNISVEI